MSTPERNDPCPCGSGKKYKKCCQEADARSLRPEDVVEASALLEEMLDSPDMAAGSNEFIAQALGPYADRIGKSLLLELESCLVVQSALYAHLVVDGVGGNEPGAATMYGRALRGQGQLGMARALEHIGSRELVLYRVLSTEPGERARLEPIDPQGGEQLEQVLADFMDLTQGGLAIGRSLYEPLQLGRHLLAFPSDVDAQAIAQLARTHQTQPERMRVLFQAWLGAWLPRLESEGVDACLGRTLGRSTFRVRDREALLAALAHTPGAMHMDLDESDEDDGAIHDADAPDVFFLNVPDEARGEFDAEFVIHGREAECLVGSANDVAVMLAFVETHLGDTAQYLQTSLKYGPSTTDAPQFHLVRAAALRSPGVVRVRATLTDIEPPIWREFDAPLAASLEELHFALVDAFGWDGEHLHQFETSIGRFRPRDPAAAAGNDVFGDTLELPIAQALTDVGEQLTWRYDLGDGWSTVVEAVDIRRDAKPVFALHGGARACPPENCGGPAGYAELVAAMSSRLHPRRRELLDWLDGEAFEAEAFDLEMHAGWVDELN